MKPVVGQRVRWPEWGGTPEVCGTILTVKPQKGHWIIEFIGDDGWYYTTSSMELDFQDSS